MVNKLSMSQGMLILDEAFLKTRKIVEGFTDVKFTPEEYQRFYECVYLLCVQKTCSENAKVLYERYKYGLEESINSLILPSLEGKTGTFLLNELVQKWSNYRVMSRWLSRFFEYLERFFIPRVSGISLQELSIKCFDNLVMGFNERFIVAATSLVNQGRNGENINTCLLKAVMDYFEATKSVGGSCYDTFMNSLLTDAAAYYSQVAENGLLCDSCADYMYKVECYFNQEDTRAGQFLDPFMRGKLMQVVKSQLVDQALPRLAEKQQAESLGRSTDFQELLSKCAGLNL